MLRLTIISILISNFCSARLYSSLSYSQENDVQPVGVDPNVQVEFVNRGEPLWILALSGDGWLAPKLRLGTSEELQEFFNDVRPVNRYPRGRQPRVKKDDPERHNSADLPKMSLNDIKKDFMLIINKFALRSSIEPDAYIADNSHDYNKDPSIKIYFKGWNTILIVELGIKQWQYIVKAESSLPEWFYEKHDTKESPIAVPEEVQIELYRSLWRLLHAIFGLSV